MSLSASAPPPPPSDAPSLPLGDSAPAIPVSSLLNVDQTIGAMSIGFSLSCLLFGVLSTQVFIYFRRYPHDMYGYKAFVVCIWMLELIGQVLIGHAVYYYTVSHFAEPLVFITGNVIWTLIVQIIFGDIVGSLVKACFALRVYRFSGRNWWVTGGIFILILGQFGLGIAYSQRSFVLDRLVFLPKLKTIATLALSANVATDATIALSLCFFLGKYRTGHRKSDTMVNKLTAYAINTGLLTSLISLATLLLYNLRPQTFEFMAMFFVLSKLYAITLMCTLTTRKIIRGRGTDREASGYTGYNYTGGQTSFIGGTATTNSVYKISHHNRTAGVPRAPHSHTHQLSAPLEIGVRQEVSVVSDIEMDEQKAFQLPQPARPAAVRPPKGDYF
ncbi:uncharacterized protein SCHCODRAFT_02625079 [Schizophyllum commune H4-8]|uniref:DUF6534 domain-containing protein n=1 Tax=Schizophyllum commune (strain H4-8 / FGSC 9210) TaxID=578458 RepID=D8Q5U1_SCHCM|nr:uncharacterized protein SCHCODRAFT_02625079 [Schizophyllum commune H4-8]KAI5892029.1 hypothetical protein SCHCODRAFT_02625079 [Schizophyllum commune H4-8]